MTTISRKRFKKRSSGGLYSAAVFCILFVFVIAVFLLIIPEDELSDNASPSKPQKELHHMGPNAGFQPAAIRQGFQEAVANKRHQLRKALNTLAEGNLPPRLHNLRQNRQIIGERLAEVRAGKETVPEILQGEDVAANSNQGGQDKPPMELHEVIDYLDSWIHQLHETLLQAKHATFEGIWQAYHDLAVKTLYPWDREYLSRMPPRRDDGSIFLSVATYRDENCFNTVYNAYAKAKNPENLFIGLVQQNCHKDCKSGVLSNLTMVQVPPDEDCYQAFCDSDLGKSGICDRHQIRVLNIDEPESLGPYAARYFTSKLWYGEQWFMQIDAHMTFATHWDATSIDMLNSAPSHKPILSHYPPSHTVNLDNKVNQPVSRLCGPVFATSDLESQIIRLEGAAIYDKQKLPVPAFAPFTAAGYFVAHSEFLREVPFDPFLPWIFMGEEIIMSSRLWTAGYDIFAPNQAVVGHIYVRRHKVRVNIGVCIFIIFLKFRF